MSRNVKRVVSLLLLASAANAVFAAPAPVSSTTSGSDVQRLERLLQNRATVQLQQQQQIDEMAQEISSLRGIIEKNSHDMKQMLDRQKELFIELDKLRSQIKSAEAPQTSAPAPAQGTYVSDKDEQAAYDSAVDLILDKKDYSGAIDAFKQFKVDFPNSVHTPNADYWLGQLYFAKKQDVEAAKNFAAVTAYTQSSKRPDSLVKLGMIAQRNNKPEVAKKYYQQVIKEYPSSSSAQTAKEQMK